ncbi:MAG: thiol:disulfide interchange protein DsbA/DsbL [Betaproteobacteria bacterium]
MTTRILRRQIVIAAAALPVAALAQPKGEPVEGQQYQLVRPPQPTESGGKVEVLEFFQYSCPHCYRFHPELEGWVKRQGAAIDFKRIPINWDGNTMPHTKIYFTLEQMGRLDLHDKVFRAIQIDRRKLVDPNEIADFMAAQGIDRKAWLDNYNSFSVNTKAARAGQIWRAYKIEGTPAVAIDGKYMVQILREGVGPTLAVMDFLVARARKK